MATTIQISKDLLNTLKARKMYDNESYEDILWCLLEDSMEFSDETKKNIAEAEADIKAGRFITHEQLKKELGLK
jgi:predicted transcriptional regulator